MNIASKLAAAAFLLTAGTAGLAGAASAGTWHANAAACPDLREDRFDSRHFNGHGDRRDDFLDRRVIDCPVYAWNYYPDRYERRDTRRLASPGRVYLDRSGRYYAVNSRGTAYAINVVIDYPREQSLLGVRFGASFGLGGHREVHDHRGWGHDRGRHGRRHH